MFLIAFYIFFLFVRIHKAADTLTYITDGVRECPVSAFHVGRKAPNAADDVSSCRFCSMKSFFSLIRSI